MYIEQYICSTNINEYAFWRVWVLHVHMNPLNKFKGNNLKQMFKSLNNCLSVLNHFECVKIVYFVPTKLLNLKILCWKQMKFVESNTSLFNRNTLSKSYKIIFIVTHHCWISIKLCLMYDQSLKGFIHCWNQIIGW